MQIEFPGLFDLQVNGFGGVDFNNPTTPGEDVLRAIDLIAKGCFRRVLWSVSRSIVCRV